jgi:ferric-dicitrate binding protein FerR (iron transport regulator)
VTKHFSSFEDVIADEDFLAWYMNSSAGKVAAWEAWLAQNPGYQPLVDESIQYLDAIKLSDRTVNDRQIEEAHDRLMKSIESETLLIQMRPRRAKWWLSAAAAILVVIASTALWINSREDQVKLNTGYGQIAKHLLPDGSEVMLNANSKLRLSKTWKENSDREVWLEGEAFFHVKKTSTKNRFIVHADGMDIIVTGTQFNVVNRDGESNILLKEGSVTLKTEGGNLLHLVPGDFVKINNRLPQKETASEEKLLAWTQAQLIFENTPLVDAAKIISRHYGVKVTVEKEVEQMPLDGIMPNDNLDVLLKTLEEAKNLRITRKDKEIVISSSHR